ncbi:MAG TPA: ferritin-like domain-containing protein [Solirubrobacteraceae bacterium]|nr:ferritin-like domain-containing protein [Solirubrobacteraceae bacterium]
MISDRIVIRDGDADTAVIAEFEATRREAMRRGLAVGGVVIAAAMVPALLNVRNAFAQARDDEAVLVAAIGLENTAIAAYAAAIKSGLLDRPTTKIAELFKRQEAQHRDGLSAALKSLGGTPPSGANAALLKPLKRVKTQAEVASFAVELETMAVAAYYDAQKKLKAAKLLQTGVQIMANEGQHLVVLRQALKKDPVPNAFENGKTAK